MDDITLLKGAVLGFILVGKVFWENFKGHKIFSGIFVSTCILAFLYGLLTESCWSGYGLKNPFSLHNTLVMS